MIYLDTLNNIKDKKKDIKIKTIRDNSNNFSFYKF